MTKKKLGPHLFVVFGVPINLSALLTTVVAGMVVFLITTSIENGRRHREAWNTVLKEVEDIKNEQARVKKEYAPEIAKKP
jgi:hypothetical protein